MSRGSLDLTLTQGWESNPQDPSRPPSVAFYHFAPTASGDVASLLFRNDARTVFPVVNLAIPPPSSLSLSDFPGALFRFGASYRYMSVSDPGFDPGGTGVEGILDSISIVPEPAATTALILAIGLIGPRAVLALWRRKRAG